MAIYIWKILEGLVPNISTDESAITAPWNQRRGRTCQVPVVSSTAPVRIQNIRRASFAIHGPCIFNSLPQYIRDTTKCDTNLFKAQLDKYLEQVTDQPPSKHACTVSVLKRYRLPESLCTVTVLACQYTVPEQYRYGTVLGLRAHWPCTGTVPSAVCMGTKTVPYLYQWFRYAVLTV